MRSYNSKERLMTMPQIVDLSDDHSTLKGRIEATRGRLVKNVPEEQKSQWIFTNTRFWSFDDQGNLLSYQEYPGDISVLLEEDLPTILAAKRDPEEMNYVELRKHIQILATRRQPVHEYRTDLIQKVTFPLGILLIMIIGFSYAARSRAGTAMAAFGYGIVWAILYYGLNASLRAFGHSGSVSPLAAGILPTIVFFVAAVYYLRRSYRWYS
jgi:lipopolysaccharide export LptBFGC system permease protein LptF